MLIQLSKRGFLICEEEYKKSTEYFCSSALIDGPEQKEERRIGATSHSARLPNGKNCSCNVFVAYQVQCQHLFAFHDGEFLLELINSKFQAQQLSVSSPNPDYTTILSAWCLTREHHIGNHGNKLFGQQSVVRSSPPTSPIPPMWDSVCDNNDTSQNYVDPGEGDVMFISIQPFRQRLQQECTVNNPTSVVTNKRKVTYHDITDVANSVTNLALSLPTEDARMACLGI
jgi:hypothetical protein